MRQLNEKDATVLSLKEDLIHSPRRIILLKINCGEFKRILMNLKKTIISQRIEVEEAKRIEQAITYQLKENEVAFKEREY